jgi:hypothetical protein
VARTDFALVIREEWLIPFGSIELTAFFENGGKVCLQSMVLAPANAKQIVDSTSLLFAFRPSSTMDKGD